MAVSVFGSTIILGYELVKKYLLKKAEGNALDETKPQSVKNESIRQVETVNALEEFN